MQLVGKRADVASALVRPEKKSSHYAHVGSLWCLKGKKKNKRKRESEIEDRYNQEMFLLLF